MSKDARPPIELTPEQKAFVEKHWQMDLRDLIQKVFANPNLTMRSKPEVAAVKKYLAELGYSASTQLTVVPPRELSPDELQYVENNHEASSPLELVRTVFRDESLTLSSPEGRAVLTILKRIAPERYNRNDEPVEDMEYKPPRNLREMIVRVRRLVPNPEGIDIPLYSGELNAQITKNLNVLLACVNIPRFIHQASQYLKKVDRELFESSFLRMIHDNTDLTAQDVDQYIAYCASIVSSAQTDRTIQRLQGQADEEFETQQKVSMVLVEHLKTLNSNLQSEKIRQQNLYKTLNGERSKRLNDLTNASISMHPLVEKWRTKQGRERLLKAAQGKRNALIGEVERLSDMDALKAEIWGISKTEIVK